MHGQLFMPGHDKLLVVCSGREVIVVTGGHSTTLWS